MGAIELKAVRKSFGAVDIIHGVDLSIEPGEFCVFVGPSGCGKSTLLRMIAGLEDTTSGEIRIEGKVVNDVEPGDRQLAMVFQSYALYPHMTVAGNMGFGLRMTGTPKPEVERRVKEAASILRLEQLMHRRPAQLSGGQRQRVAMGRALVRDPALFLFDEPLSNLDAALRVQMRLEITQLHQALKTTMIYVTHDQVEAMTMADKIVVLNAGKIEQVGAPLELYNNPANLFVAGFIGSPKMNLLNGAIAQQFGAGTIGIRPEHIAASRDRGDWQGVVRVAEHLGSDTFLHIDAETIGRITARAPGELALTAGDKVGLTPRPDRIHRFDSDGRAMRA